MRHLVKLVMAVALLGTGWPLVRPWIPSGPLPAAVPAAGTSAVVPGQIVVDARDSLSDADLDALDRKYGVDFRLNSVHADDENLLIADVTPGTEAALLERLRKDPAVEAAEPMHRYSINWTPNDPRFKEQWNLKLIGAEKAWDKTRGKGVVVAVIDTGVAFENDDKCYRARDFGETKFTKGYDFVNDDEHPNDDHGHGTHVSGTIAETTNNAEGVAGLAFEATIMPIKVLNEFGGGTSADIADAIRWAADNGAHIINMSLGGSMPDMAMRMACRYAAKKGVLIVCAAGNSGGGPVGYPAAFPECFAVSAVGPSGKLARYSSVGKQVGIAAPGGDKSTGENDGILQNTVLFDTGQREDDYFSFQGTSMASPHVAAAAALAMSMGVKDAAEVKQLLQRAATPQKPAEHYGAGVLNAEKTVALAEDARRDSFWKLIFSLAVGLAGLGVGAVRGRVGGLLRFPFAPLGLLLGFWGPDLVFHWIGFGSPFNILLHSALIPLYLLWEAESKPVYRFVGTISLGVALHLAWDAWQAHAPFVGVLPMHAAPWLYVNAAVGVGVALVAWARSFRAAD